MVPHDLDKSAKYKGRIHGNVLCVYILEKPLGDINLWHWLAHRSVPSSPMMLVIVIMTHNLTTSALHGIKLEFRSRIVVKAGDYFAQQAYQSQNSLDIAFDRGPAKTRTRQTNEWHRNCGLVAVTAMSATHFRLDVSHRCDEAPPEADQYEKSAWQQVAAKSSHSFFVAIAQLLLVKLVYFNLISICNQGLNVIIN